MRQARGQQPYAHPPRPAVDGPSARPAGLAVARQRTFDTWREVVLALVVTSAYFLTRGLIRGRTADALAHAHDILDIEQALHIEPEEALQRLALLHPLLLQAANLFYLAGHLPVLIAVAVWLYRAHHAAYRVFRNAFGLSALLGLSIYVVLPVAPPRFLPGFVDTLKATGLGLDGSAIGLLYNPYAAMPSLHVGWALLAGLALAINGRAQWARLAGAALPLLMTLTVLVTGNHYLLDIAAGTGIALLSLTCSWWLAAARGRAGNRPDTEGRCRMLSGRSRRLPPPLRTRVIVAGQATTRATITRATTTRRPGSALRTRIHPFPLAFPREAPGPRRLLALPAASPVPSSATAQASHKPGAAARGDHRGRARFALRALIPPALLFVVLVVPPQSLRATLVTLLIIAALGLVVWRLPMTDEE